MTPRSAPCAFHEGCTQPCPIEAALHLEIQAMAEAGSALARAAQKRRGRPGGYHARPAAEEKR